MSKLYPIGIQNFESLRKDGYFYVDKTRLIYQLVKTGRYYILSGKKRTFRGTCHRTTGKGLDKAPDTASGLEQ